MSRIAPGWRFWGEVKKKYPKALVLVRMGPDQEDFMEAYGRDARTLVRELDLTLSSRVEAGTGHRIPMAGFPIHACQRYMRRLVDLGYTLAVAEVQGLSIQTGGPNE